MSACSFSVPFSGQPADIHKRARAAVQDQGGHFQGDESSGAFELTVLGSNVRGNYRIAQSALHVTIENKPSMIPCSTIQSYLARHVEFVEAGH